MCDVSVAGEQQDGYVNSAYGIGSGDYIEFSHCLDCGQIQGTFPLAETPLEKQAKLSTEMMSPEIQTFADWFLLYIDETLCGDPIGIVERLLDPNDPATVAGTLLHLSRNNYHRQAVECYDLIYDWDRIEEVEERLPGDFFDRRR